MCATSKFAKGKLERWNMTQKICFKTPQDFIALTCIFVQNLIISTIIHVNTSLAIFGPPVG